MASGKPNPPADAEALQSTRQMLDELDALMERMLNLPVAEAEEAAPPPLPAQPAAPLPGPKSPLLSARLTLLQSSPEPPPEKPAIAPPHRELNPTHLSRYELPPLPAAEPSLPIPSPTFAPAPLPDLPAAETAPEPFSNQVMPAARGPTLDLGFSPDYEPPPTPVDRCFLALVWANRSFEVLTDWLGGPADRLRTPAGRGALGFAGVALLAVAALWLLKDWLGWTW